MLPVDALTFSCDEVCRQLVDEVGLHLSGHVREAGLSAEAASEVEVEWALGELAVSVDRDSGEILRVDRALVELDLPTYGPATGERLRSPSGVLVDHQAVRSFVRCVVAGEGELNFLHLGLER